MSRPTTTPAHPFRLRALTMACALLMQSGLVHADERVELEKLRATTTALLDALVESGLLSREKADAIRKQAQDAGQAVVANATPAASSDAAEAAKKPNIIRIPYLTETAKAELRDQVKNDVLAQAYQERWGEPGALPSWLHRISFVGDVRMRFQHESFDHANTPPDDIQYGYAYQTVNGAPVAWSPDVVNTQHDRDRFTVRGRAGIMADLGHGFDTGLRLSTGSGISPVGASQTQGSYFNKYSVYIDQAFVRYNQEGKWLASAGRTTSPFYGTDLTWPDDVNLDGLSVSYKPALGAGQNVFMTAGVFPLQEIETSTHDKWLYGAQVGMTLPISQTTQWRAGLALYDFQNVAGVQDTQMTPAGLPQAITQPYAITQYPSGVRQKGNTLIRINNPDGIISAGSPSVWGLASKFRPLNFSTDVTFLQFYPTKIKASLDVIKNLGFDINDIRSRSGQSDLALNKQTLAVQAKVMVGEDRIERAGQWQGFLTFRRFERDAWVDAFTDTTWNLGGTNYQGWSLGGQYGVGPRTSLGLRWTSTHNLSDPAMVQPTFKVDVLQLEVNARF